MTAAFFARALDELAREAGGGQIVSITVPVRPVPVDRLLRLPLGIHPYVPLLFWAPPAEPSRGGFSFAGFGEVVRIEEDGPLGLAAVRDRGQHLLRSLSSRIHPECVGVPPPCLFGGVAFRPESVRRTPWSGFRDASFSLPRWLYGTSAESAFLRLSLRADELSDTGAIAGEAHQISEAIAALACMEARLEEETVSRRAAENGSSHPAGSRIEAMGAADFCALVTHALESIREKALEKVVAIAWSHITSAHAVDVATALQRMGGAYADCVRFALQRDGATFAGASPEQLVTLHGLSVEADALAGTAGRGQQDDAVLVRSLSESDKDRREHALVVDAIVGALRPVCTSLHVPVEPVIRSLRNVHHLWTPIRGELRSKQHVLDLVAVLHPTPAVCGTPRQAAIDWISAHELASRGWYAGAVGWFDALGDGSFSVAIRAGLLKEHDAWLYAGAGIVEGSDPSAEYAETRAKQTPMLAALGLMP